MEVLVKEKCESPWRWPILFLTCLMMIGNYYCYDIPAALHTQLDDYMGNPSDFETYFSLLYTVYSVPNVILPFFGGYFVDRWGVRTCLFIFTGLLCVGQVVFAFGVSVKSWPIMLVGRTIYGFGGESLSVGNAAVLSVWFKGKELAFAFGLNLSIARLGSVINNLVSPQLASSFGIQFALWFGVILISTSVVSVVGISSIDTYMDSVLVQSKGQHAALASGEEEADLIDKDIRESHENLRQGLLADAPDTGRSSSTSGGGMTKMNVTDRESGTQSVGTVGLASAGGRRVSTESAVSAAKVEQLSADVNFNDVFKFKQAFWVISISCMVVYGCVLPFNNIESALLLERDYFMTPPAGCQLVDTSQCEDTNPASATYNPVEGCPSSKWYQPPIPVNFTTSDIDCTQDKWSEGCTSDFCDRQDDATIQAGKIMSIPYIISACLSPFLGAFVDKFGNRAIIATIAPMLLFGVHFTLGYTDLSPIGPLVGQGLSYSAFAAVIWPSVPLVVPDQLVGLAYGVITSIQNIGLASFPLVIASIYSASGDEYIPNCELFFMILALLGVVVGVYLNLLDYFYLNSKLNGTGDKPEEDEDLDFKVIRAASLDNQAQANRLSQGGDYEGRASSGSRNSGGSRNSAELFSSAMVH